jgi:hypothetical protein
MTGSRHVDGLEVCTTLSVLSCTRLALSVLPATGPGLTGDSTPGLSTAAASPIPLALLGIEAPDRM